MSRVLVTGASRGIGQAIARAFAAQGDRVVVHYGSAREDAEDTLNSLAGEGHALVGGNIEDAAERIVHEAVAALGGLDILVNNAAVAPGPATATASTRSRTRTGSATSPDGRGWADRNRKRHLLFRAAPDSAGEWRVHRQCRLTRGIPR